MRIVCVAMFLAVSASSALAQREPQIVVPGRPGVPVYINGIDASWSIVEGDFGLDRPGTPKTIIYRPYLMSSPYRGPGFYPHDGRRPGYGRLEVWPKRNRVLPPPAPTYFREWTSESAPGPVNDAPLFAPTVIAPRIGINGDPHAAPHHSDGHRKDP